MNAYIVTATKKLPKVELKADKLEIKQQPPPTA